MHLSIFTHVLRKKEHRQTAQRENKTSALESSKPFGGVELGLGCLSLIAMIRMLLLRGGLPGKTSKLWASLFQGGDTPIFTVVTAVTGLIGTS